MIRRQPSLSNSFSDWFCIQAMKREFCLLIIDRQWCGWMAQTPQRITAGTLTKIAKSRGAAPIRDAWPTLKDIPITGNEEQPLVDLIRSYARSDDIPVVVERCPNSSSLFMDRWFLILQVPKAFESVFSTRTWISSDPHSTFSRKTQKITAFLFLVEFLYQLHNAMDSIWTLGTCARMEAPSSFTAHNFCQTWQRVRRYRSWSKTYCCTLVYLFVL